VRFVVTIQIGLYCMLVTSPPSSLPLDPLPAPLKAIARGFFVLFRISIWSPSTKFPHLNALHSPSHKYPLILYLFYIMSFIINISLDVQRGFSKYHHFGPFNPFHYSSLPFYLPPPFFNSFQYRFFNPLLSPRLCFRNCWNSKKVKAKNNEGYLMK
jgi:hypothetical protein